jgi:NADPH:quinone reductase-like Zn-dependent oxidoreductase
LPEARKRPGFGALPSWLLVRPRAAVHTRTAQAAASHLTARSCSSSSARPLRDSLEAVLTAFLDAVAAGDVTVPIAKTYTMYEIATAHDAMEHGRVAGKLVVSTGR